MQVLVCSRCGESGGEPEFHDEATEQWRCPNPECLMDESGVLIVDTDELKRRAEELRRLEAIDGVNGALFWGVAARNGNTQ